ncbi:MAG TPA: carboxypeptidase regulatory-like domain-containing protein [Vicinamibacterales bacterium]|nr:carboxypeptidase regulatory-like domain-containing protein [Vicinamibacterales bacterium]
MNHHVVVACLVAVHLLAPAASQVTSDGQLRGTVRDATGAVVVNAAVVIASPHLIGGAQSVSTGSDGQWRRSALPPGDYTITVAAPGFDAVVRDRVRMLAGGTLIVDVDLAIAPTTERARVEGSRPVVDVTSAAVAFNLGEPLLRGLPTSRTFSDLINLVPGVAGEQAFGGTKRSNGLFIDGVDTTESSEQNPWLRFNQNWLQEVQVAGLGAEAEYGLSTGVTAFGLVRSGTNRYAGLGEFWMTPGAWVATNTQALSQTLQRRFASARIDSYWNTNGQVGGPLRTDRLWFFAGLDHTTNDGAPAGYQGSDSQQEDDTRAIGKLTWNAWNSARIDGFVQGGRRRIRNRGLSAQVPAEAASAYRQPQLSGNVRFSQSVGRSLLFDAQYAGYFSPETVEPQPPASKDGPPGHVDQLSGNYSVNALQYSSEHRWRQTMALAGTWHAGGASNHEIKFGLQVERSREQTTSGFPGGRLYLDLGPAPDTVLLSDESVLRGDTARLTLYIQDRLRLGTRVTLSPGLRVDRFRWSTTEVDGVLATSPVSPRIGIAWDVSPNHRTVVRAHYGRYTDPAFAQPILLTDDADRPVQISARVVAPDVFEETARQDFRGSRRIDSDIRHSYVDQFVGGVEHQLAGQFAVIGQYIHREFGAFSAYVTDNLSWLPVERRDPGPDGLTGTGDDGELFTVYSRIVTGPATSVYTNLDKAWRQYRAGQLVLRTTAAGPWQLQASYTRSQTRGTMTTGLHANAGVRFLGSTTNPNRLINGDSNTAYDPTNEVKILSIWYPPQLGGWVLSGVYRYLTGGAWGRTFFATQLAQGRESVRAEPRDTNRLPAISQLDLHVEKSVRFGSRTLGTFADVFNVWNQGAPDSEWGDPVISSSGPNLGVPTLWRAPRQVRIGLQLTF